MLTEAQIVKGCKRYKRKAQKALYDKYYYTLRNVCLRYSSAATGVDDILQEGFITIFSKIKQYKGKGSFEGWLKRIMVHKAIDLYRKNKKYQYHYDIDEINETSIPTDDTDDNANQDVRSVIENSAISDEDILRAVDKLPYEYKVVFNMYAVEHYKHKEIARILNISVSTSKIRLMRARKQLQDILYHYIKKQNTVITQKNDTN